MARVPAWFSFGNGNRPSSTLITALVADGKAYSAASNILAIASNATPAQQTAGVALFNPVANTANFYVYGVVLTSDTAGVKIRIQHVTADPALGTAVVPVNRYRQAVLGVATATVSTSVAGGQAIPSTSLSDSFITGTVPILLDDDLSATWLTPGSGILISFNEETASTPVNVGATLYWSEMSIS